ncbi:MAG TPA: ABC transporter substrate-binding protein [Actinocrinis sp.]|jgi:alpha-glucoside transport system substrate-binding protein
MSATTARITRCAAALGLLAAAAGCSGSSQGATVTIMVPWSGPEFAAFYNVAEQFARKNHFTLDFEVTRAQTDQLNAAVKAGDPPDLAVLPSVGAVDQYANPKVRDLQPLDIQSKDFFQPFRGLMTDGVANGTVYAVPVKADVKSLIWYDPKHTAAPSTDPAALEASKDRWCLGLESGPTSGWPGADWIADLFLAENGATAYENWLKGAPEWTGPLVQRAWNTWESLVVVGDSTADSATTAFGDAAAGMYQSSTCRLAHGALAAMAFPASLNAGSDYDFVVPAAPAPLEVSADFLGMFTRNNPDAVALINYLSGAAAQAMWVHEPGGYAFSANSQVSPSAYPNDVERRIAALLRPDSGHPLCFGAADMMAPDMSTSFYQSVMYYVEDSTPSTLATQLSGLDRSQNEFGSSPVSEKSICSSPTLP